MATFSGHVSPHPTRPQIQHPHLPTLRTPIRRSTHVIPTPPTNPRAHAPPQFDPSANDSDRQHQPHHHKQPMRRSDHNPVRSGQSPPRAVGAAIHPREPQHPHRMIPFRHRRTSPRSPIREPTHPDSPKRNLPAQGFHGENRRIFSAIKTVVPERAPHPKGDHANAKNQRHHRREIEESPLHQMTADACPIMPQRQPRGPRSPSHHARRAPAA
jgi:hypothetical protein